MKRSSREVSMARRSVMEGSAEPVPERLLGRGICRQVQRLAGYREGGSAGEGALAGGGPAEGAGEVHRQEFLLWLAGDLARAVRAAARTMPHTP